MRHSSVERDRGSKRRARHLLLKVLDPLALLIVVTELGAVQQAQHRDQDGGSRGQGQLLELASV